MYSTSTCCCYSGGGAEVSYLPNDALDHCLELYADDARRVRSEVVWMAVRRGVPSYVRETERLAERLATLAAALKLRHGVMGRLGAREAAAAAAVAAAGGGVGGGAAAEPVPVANSSRASGVGAFEAMFNKACAEAERKAQEAAERRGESHLHPCAVPKLGRARFHGVLRDLGFDPKAEEEDMRTVADRVFVSSTGAEVEEVAFADVLAFFDRSELLAHRSRQEAPLQQRQNNKLIGGLQFEAEENLVRRDRASPHRTGLTRATLTRAASAQLSMASAAAGMRDQMRAADEAAGRDEGARQLQAMVERQLAEHEGKMVALLAQFKEDALRALDRRLQQAGGEKGGALV